MQIILKILLVKLSKTVHSPNMNNTPAAVTDRNAKHTYAIEIAPGQSIRVDANNRSQAAARAKKAGYNVRSVNMLG